MSWVLTIRPAAAESPELRRPYRAATQVVFSRVGDKQLTADIYRPDDDQSHPGVLLIHGGAWSSGDKWNMRDHARELAQAGYVAVSINYRLAPKYKFPAQLEDCRQALAWMAQQSQAYRIDINRVAVYGYSAGGHLAALLATDPIEGLPPVRAAVIGGAPCDLSFIPENSPVVAHVIGGTRRQVPHLYDQASPLSYVSPDDCPMFFFHGDTDIIVPQRSSRIMFERAKQAGVRAEYCSIDDYGHLLTFVHPDARRAAIAFLNEHLQQAN